MSNDNFFENNDSEFDKKENSGGNQEHAPRARNRTVMLTPEMTGQVRARLAMNESVQNISGYETPKAGGSKYQEDSGFSQVKPYSSGVNNSTPTNTTPNNHVIYAPSGNSGSYQGESEPREIGYQSKYNESSTNESIVSNYEAPISPSQFIAPQQNQMQNNQAAYNQNSQINYPSNSNNNYQSNSLNGSHANTDNFGSAFVNTANSLSNRTVQSSNSTNQASYESDSSSYTSYDSNSQHSKTGNKYENSLIESNEKKIENAVWVKITPVVGFLVSFDNNSNGDIYELRSGRLVVTSDDNIHGQNYILINDETVSPCHAFLRITQDGEIQLLDQLSEYGTKIKRFGSDEEIELSGEKSTVEHGDLIMFGNRKFHVTLLAIPEK